MTEFTFENSHCDEYIAPAIIDEQFDGTDPDIGLNGATCNCACG